MKALSPIVSLALFVICYSASAQTPNFLTNGLRSWYRFNGNYLDSWGGDNGTPHNVSFGLDRFGNSNQAASFVGDSSSYIVIPTTNFNLANLSVSVWINPTVGIGTQGPRVFSTGGYELTCDSPVNNLGLSPRFVEFFGPNQSSVFSAGVWTHVVATISSNEARIYLNGTLSSAATISQPPDFSNGWFPTIGANAGNYANDDYGGLIDDIRVYNRALSADEVSQLYQYEAPPTVVLVKAVKPNFFGLKNGTDYQLQLSGDLNTWTNQGSPFTATNYTMEYPQYWDVDNWNQLFFRLQVVP